MWTYSPTDVDANILGVDIEGWSTDTFIKIEPDSPTFTYRRSAFDGSTMPILNKFRAYNVTFSLASSSPTNTWLHLLHNLFSKHGIIFKLPILIRDKSGNTSFFATDCWFDGEPTKEFSSKVTTTDWKLRCNSAQYQIGGNGENNSAVQIIASLQQALQIAGVLGINTAPFANVLGSF